MALDVAVGGCYHANINTLGAIHAKGPNFTVLQDAQELGLQAQGHFGNFVEKEGAAVGFDKQTLTIRIRGRVGAACVAE